MKIFSKEKTDKEYIESVVWLHKKRWFIFIPAAVVAILIFLSALYFINKIDKQAIELLDNMKLNEDYSIKEHNAFVDKSQYIIGFRIGYTLCGVVYISIFLFITSISMTVTSRKDKLLIKLYEKLEKQKQNSK
jgi:hypothetical protein